MAVMIPAEYKQTLCPRSEQTVFAAIQKHLPDDWTVFHSLDYITRTHSNQLLEGEIDFLFFHPQKGFLIMEVKGGIISCQNQVWYQDGRVIDPFGQAQRGKYALIKLLQEKLNRPIPIKVAHSVCFPGCGYMPDLPPEAREITLSGDAMAYIRDFVEKTLEDAYMPQDISGSVSRQEILDILTPAFEYGTKLSERIAEEEEIFFTFTEEQCRLLNIFTLFKRLKVCGCAGSGKTIMAVKKARALAAENKSVLLLCFNQMLAGKLKKATFDCCNITADAFFEYCIKLLKLDPEEVNRYRNNPKLYSDVLPGALKKYLSQTMLYYDAVIVDEGQDFSKEAWDVISLLPESDGHFYIFYDPDQNVFHRSSALPDFGMEPAILDRNCRNTRKIFDAIKHCSPLAAGVISAAPEGSDVRVLDYTPDALAGELDRLIQQEQVSLNDIVVIGAHNLQHTSAVKMTHPRFKLVEGHGNPAANEISYHTYMKFKGCESKVVILLDYDENDPRWDKEGFYTAASRAIHHLTIIKKGNA